MENECETKDVAAYKMHSKLPIINLQKNTDDMNNSTVRIIRASNWTKPQGKGAWVGGWLKTIIGLSYH